MDNATGSTIFINIKPIIIMKKFIIRTEKAGVFFAEIKEKNGSELVLTNARRLWYWAGAASLSQLATDGTSSPNGCKFTVVVDEMTINNWIEIIPCTDKAIESINAVRIWEA